MYYFGAAEVGDTLSNHNLRNFCPSDISWSLETAKQHLSSLVAY